MALYKVKKTPLKNHETNEMFELGDLIERNVKDVTEFEKKFGNDYLERVEENQVDKKDDKDNTENTSTKKK